ncbi:MAG: two-component system sensor histidine kinase NtrB [Bradymonadaceae bacterium]
MIKHVEYRAFEPLIRVAKIRGLSEAELTRGLLPHELLLRGRGYVNWDDFALYCQRFEDAMGGPDALADVGLILSDTPSYVALLRLGGLVTSPKWFFHVLLRWFGPSKIPAVRYGNYEDIDEKTLRVSLFSPADLEHCPAFFRIVASFFRYGPCLVGIQPAFVTMELNPHQATYTIQLPPSASILARLKRAFQSAWAGHGMLDELALQHENLLDSYEMLERSEASFRSLIESSPEGIVVFTLNEILYVNHSMSKFLGADEPAAIIGLSIDDICRDCRDLAMEIEAREEAPRRTEDIAFRTMVGGIVWAEVNTIQAQFQGKSAFVSIARDITLRHQVLAQAVEMDRMISMGTLAAGVGHEIKNPLAYVKANMDFSRAALQALSSRLNGKPVPPEDHAYWNEELDEVDRALKSSAEGADRLLTIAEDLTTFSRTPGHCIEAVMLEEAIRTATSVARHEIRHRATLITELKCVSPVRANANQLTQVLLNLLINAAQAIPYGDMEQNEIRVRTKVEGEQAIIEIEDTGAGISPKDMEHIFDPFFTTKPAGEGTGLGLSISRNIIESMGGGLIIESKQGVGTCARVALGLYDSEDN